MLDMRIKYHSEDIGEIIKIEQGDWIDLKSAVTVSLEAFEFRLISLGVSVEIPKGYEMHIVPRGSTYKNFGVIQTNSMGIIDNSFCGDDDVLFFPALALRQTAINIGDRICQFRLIPKQHDVNLIKVDTLGNKNRGSHGSTGIR